MPVLWIFKKPLIQSGTLVLLTPIAEGLQQNLNLLHTLWQTWALTINPQKKYLLFRKNPEVRERNAPLVHTHTHTQLKTPKNIKKMEGAESADGLACVGIIIEGVEVLHDLDNTANVLAICLLSCTHWT